MTVQGKLVDRVSHFIYLGATISSHGTIGREMTLRLQKASEHLVQIISSLRYERIVTSSKSQKLGLQGSNKSLMKDVYCLRRIEWFHHIRNTDVLISFLFQWFHFEFQQLYSQ